MSWSLPAALTLLTPSRHCLTACSATCGVELARSLLSGRPNGGLLVVGVLSVAGGLVLGLAKRVTEIVGFFLSNRSYYIVSANANREI